MSENQEVGVVEDESHLWSFGSEEGYWRALAPFSHFTDVETETLNQVIGQGHKSGHDRIGVRSLYFDLLCQYRGFTDLGLLR